MGSTRKTQGKDMCRQWVGMRETPWILSKPSISIDLTVCHAGDSAGHWRIVQNETDMILVCECLDLY